MRVVVSVDNKIAPHMAQNMAAVEIAVTRGVAETARGVQTAWRGQIGPVLGRKLANTVRMRVFPEGQPSPNAAALVWTKAPDIIGAHEKGVVIRSRDGFFLAIPTPAAGRGGGGRRLTPGEWEQRRGIKLRFVYRQGRPSLLVADSARIGARGIAAASRSKTGRGFTTVPIFILVPQVRLPKRLNLKAAGIEGGQALPGAIRRNLQLGRIK